MQLSWKRACLGHTKPQVWSSALYKTSAVAHTCKPQEAKTGQPEVQDHPGLHREFKDSLSCFVIFFYYYFKKIIETFLKRTYFTRSENRSKSHKRMLLRFPLLFSVEIQKDPRETIRCLLAVVDGLSFLRLGCVLWLSDFRDKSKIWSFYSQRKEPGCK